MSINNRGCCYWLCKCLFRTNESSDSQSSSQSDNREANINPNNLHADRVISNDNNRSINTNRNLNRNQLSNVITNYNTLGNTDQEFQNRYNHIINKFKLNTQIEKQKIISLNEYAKTINNKFNCPICLKYLNHILKSSCCGNYICIFCYDDYITTNIKYDFVINCPFCGVEEKTIIFDDVKSEDILKNYTNSANQSPLNNSLNGNVNAPCPNNVVTLNEAPIEENLKDCVEAKEEERDIN